MPRAQLESWLQNNCRPLLAAVDGATMLDLLLKHTFGEHLACVGDGAAFPASHSCSHSVHTRHTGHSQVYLRCGALSMATSNIPLSHHQRLLMHICLRFTPGTTGRFVQYSTFISDLEDLVMAGGTQQVCIEHSSISCAMSCHSSQTLVMC